MKLLVVARAEDISGDRHDGLIARHRRMILRLAESHSVEILTLNDDSALAVHPELQALVGNGVNVGRGLRLRERLKASAARQGRTVTCWQQQVLEIIRDQKPDVVVTVGPWWNLEFRPLFDRLPVVHLFEEDVWRLPQMRPVATKARLLHRIRLGLDRHPPMTPKAVVVISNKEVPAARRRFPLASIDVVPFTLDNQQWPACEKVSRGNQVLVVGALHQERNAHGLAEVLDALGRRRPDDLRVVLVSAQGLHPELQKSQYSTWVSLATDIATDVQLYDLYRRSRIALVPAKSATGMKTTILQAWAAGCPVVASRVSGETLGIESSGAMDIGVGGDELAIKVILCWQDLSRRQRLQRTATAVYRDHFDDGAWMKRFEQLCSGVAGPSSV